MSGPRGLLLAAPASGSGKTLATLGLLRALKDAGTKVAGLKVGPDYIDPAFHAAACGRPCLNLDAWAMRPATMARVLADLGRDTELVAGEGVMGLFDGAPGGAGSTADVAKRLGWPVVLVADARGMAASATALLEGFARHDPDLEVAGVIFNRVGGTNHARLLHDAAAAAGLACLGCLPRDDALAVPSRHLGLVQAGEHPEIEALLAAAGRWAARHLDLDALASLARPSQLTEAPGESPLPPLGQRIAVARDEAFAFAYPAVIEGWRRCGAEIRPFSPLADEAPDSAADAVYLPGGYPELHAGRLGANQRFLSGLRGSAERGATVYGECGGYMALGETLTDADGDHHAMAGLLPLDTSFAERRMVLGYRTVQGLGGPFAGLDLRGHEFHFASVQREGPGDPLFHAGDAHGRDLGPAGLRRGTVCGSFLHLIDTAAGSFDPVRRHGETEPDARIPAAADAKH